MYHEACGLGAPAQTGQPIQRILLGYMSDKASPLRQPAPPADNAALQREVADLIVAALNLDVAAADIDPQAPLYGEGLGLDSIDILEIALVVSKQYGIQLRADSEENEQIFRSLRYLADYIAAHRTK
jgi:acyl carrier protein